MRAEHVFQALCGPFDAGPTLGRNLTLMETR